MIHHRLLMLFVKIGLGPQVEPQFATKNMVVAFVNTRKYKIKFLNIFGYVINYQMFFVIKSYNLNVV